MNEQTMNEMIEDALTPSFFSDYKMIVFKNPLLLTTAKSKDVSDDDIKKGLASAFIPARLEVVCKNPIIIIDGAHNPDGAKALCEVVKKFENVTAIVGVMRDKNYGEVLSLMLPLCKNVVCVSPNVPRALPIDELARVAKKYCNNVFVADDLKYALNFAREKSGQDPIVIFGSLYLASEIRPLLRP